VALLTAPATLAALLARLAAPDITGATAAPVSVAVRLGIVAQVPASGAVTSAGVAATLADGATASLTAALQAAGVAVAPPAAAAPLGAPSAPTPAAVDGRAFCASSGAFCVRWAADVDAASVTFDVSARTGGYVALGFAEQYNVMSPADVFAVWVDASSGAGVLSHRRNANGYDAPTVRPLPPGAALQAASSSDSALTAQFTVPLPAAAGVVNLIWCVADGVPSGRDAPMDSHGGREGVDFGAAAIDLLCAGDGSCVLSVPPPRAFTRLHVIALAGFGATLGAGALATALRRRWFALECAAQASLARTPLKRAAAALGASSYGAPEALLLGGYALTFAFYLSEALRLNPASPARAVGTLLAPAFATALLPVTRHSLWVPLLGVSFERAVAFHRAAAGAAVAVMVAHAAMMVVERGVPILSQRATNARGDGAVFGTAAAAAFAAMAALSAPPVRRHAWELFKAVHLTLMPAAVVLSILHARMMLPYLLPPLALWAADVAMRTARSARSHAVASVTPLPGGAVRVSIRTGGALRVAPGQFAYLQLPAVAAAEWHPLSCVCAPGAPRELSFIISAGGPSSFGARIAAHASAHTSPLRARVDGAFGGPALALHRYTSVLLVAGGVGITPFVSVAAHLIALAAAKDAPLRAASLLWAVRDADAPHAWLPELLPSLHASGLFCVRVCVTGGGGAARDAEEGGVVLRRAGSGVVLQRGRPDVAAAVRQAVAAAAVTGAPPSRVAVLACGPSGLVAAAQAAAAAAGAHFHSETFIL
jgi:ferredoxin-NADP reductase